MKYQEVEDFLFNQLPIYQKQGIRALNRSLEKTKLLLNHLGNPQQNFKSVLVAGTNGKGSSCHMLASILQEAGYKTGLHTSPHLKSYTERIRINGIEIEKEYVTSFITKNINVFKEQTPSFFEITVALAFSYFSDQQVDIATVEVGMGGTYDSTNVLEPMVSLITNIGLDHQHILGNTIAEIAHEKAGIIKENTPVVVSVTQDECAHVFKEKAKKKNAMLVFGDIQYPNSFDYEIDLNGNYQKNNVPGVLGVVDVLTQNDFAISNKSIRNGLKKVAQNTGLKGRWQKISDHPLMICDTAHNVDGIREIVNQIKKIDFKNLSVVFGMVEDKKLSEIVRLLPNGKNVYYYFVEPNIPRAMNVETLFRQAKLLGLEGEMEKDVNKAIEKAKNKSGKNDMIYIGGSTFVVAEIANL